MIQEVSGSGLRNVRGGERDAAAIQAAVEQLILSHPHTKIDYVTLCDPVTLEAVPTLRGETLLALAVRVGKTRLIDNCLLGKKSK